jgi:hypothetical protein
MYSALQMADEVSQQYQVKYEFRLFIVWTGQYVTVKAY